MGDVVVHLAPSPQAIEQTLPWGLVLRGLRWGTGPGIALLLHDPGADLDIWSTLPAEIARQLEIETVAVDLPGHGLSDDPWEPERLSELLHNLPELAPAAGRRLLIAAGGPATAALEQALSLELSGLVCLSPRSPADGWRPPRSPRVPKLFVAGSLAGSDLDDARRLATSSGGWAIVTSYPVAGQGTALLASPWRGRLTEEIVAFLRDCLKRQPLASLPIDRRKPRLLTTQHNSCSSPNALGRVRPQRVAGGGAGVPDGARGQE